MKTKLALLATLITALVSCETLTGSLSYTDAKTGAKGGLDFAPGAKPTGFVFLPIYDDQGKQTGAARLGNSAK
jgi:hypothetical protein